MIGAERGPRAALRAELIELGHDAIGFETLRDAVLAGATETNDTRLRGRPWTRWLGRPVTLGAIADALAPLIAAR